MKKQVASILLVAALLLSACGVAKERDITPASNMTASGEEAGITAPVDASAADDIGVIQAVVSRNGNYVYHMMAVSGCGYDNAYGNRYRSLHAETDLQILKNNERHLTVKGGEYQGDLYFLIVAFPASFDDDIAVDQYFAALTDLFATGDIVRNFEAYRGIYERTFSAIAEVDLDSFQVFYESNQPLSAEIADIAAVMYNHYPIYMDAVWETSLAQLSVASARLNQQFAQRDYAGKWEDALDHRYGHDTFYALLCNAMDNGPDCIDVSENKDVFQVTEDYEAMARRISHEFGMYILIDMLADTPYQGYDYWGLKEGLAEYFNIGVSGGYPNWVGGEEYIAFYEQLRADDPELSARDMFLRAVDVYMPAALQS